MFPQKLPAAIPVLVHRMLSVRHLRIHQVDLLRRVPLLLRAQPHRKCQVRVRQLLPALRQAINPVHLRAMSQILLLVQFRARHQVPGAPQVQVRVPHQVTVLVPLQMEVQVVRVPALRRVQVPGRLRATLQVTRLVRAPVLHPVQVQVHILAKVRVQTPRIQVTRRRQAQATNQAHRLAGYQVLPRAHLPAVLLVGARAILQVTTLRHLRVHLLLPSLVRRHRLVRVDRLVQVDRPLKVPAAPPVIDHLCRLVRRRAIAPVIILLRVPRRLEVLFQQKLPVTNPVSVHRMLPVRNLTIHQVDLPLVLRVHPRRKHQVGVHQLLQALPQATSRVNLLQMSRVRHQVRFRARDLVVVRAPNQAEDQIFWTDMILPKRN